MIEAGKSRVFWSPVPVDRHDIIHSDPAGGTVINEQGATEMVELTGFCSDDGLTVSVDRPTPTELGLTTAWSAADWRNAYNALSWRSDWPAIASLQVVTSGRWHPSSLISLSKLLARDPAERSLTEILRARQRRRAAHLEYRRRARARARRGRR